MNKNIKYVALGIALIGGYMVVKNVFSKKTTTKLDEPKVDDTKVDTTKVVENVVVKDFPIKKGDKDSGSPLAPKGKVVELQKLINIKGYQAQSDKFMGKPLIKLVEDGIFGAKTEQALQFWIQKKSIDNQLDLNYLKNKINPSI